MNVHIIRFGMRVDSVCIAFIKAMLLFCFVEM